MDNSLHSSDAEACRTDVQVQECPRDVPSTQQELVWILGKTAEHRAEGNRNHVIRIGLISRAIAQALGWEPSRAESLALAAPLHDIGKIGVPDRIFLKKGCLTPSEIAVMHWHCWIGAKILLDPSALESILLRYSSPEKYFPLLQEMKPVFTTAASIALAHHEKWDGSGYPRELQGEEIPLEARIVAMADVYDALTSDRPFRPAYSEEWALEALDEQEGKHFDPCVYTAFLKNLPQIRSFRRQYPDNP
ncbi:MAG: HD domain-containing protein [Pirellulales bacterium]|nr:HD domain-containing protein [Pirellulales bacterium]